MILTLTFDLVSQDLFYLLWNWVVVVVVFLLVNNREQFKESVLGLRICWRNGKFLRDKKEELGREFKCVNG